MSYQVPTKDYKFTISSCLPSVSHELAIDGRGFRHVVGGDCAVRPPQQHIGRDLAAHDRDLRRQVHPNNAQHPPSLPCSLLPSPRPATAASTCLSRQTQALDPPPPGGSAITCRRRAPPALPPPIQTPPRAPAPARNPTRPRQRQDPAALAGEMGRSGRGARPNLRKVPRRFWNVLESGAGGWK